MMHFFRATKDGKPRVIEVRTQFIERMRKRGSSVAAYLEAHGYTDVVALEVDNVEPPVMCPWCRNPDFDFTNELAVEKVCVPPAMVVPSYRVACSCGACGPHADTREQAEEKWNEWLANI